MTCASTRAATSWCGACSSTTAATSSRPRDGRVVFALPFERDFTLIGTTDRSFAGDPASVAPARRRDRLSLRRRRTNISAPRSRRADVVWSFAGVRSLYDDGSRRPQDARATMCSRSTSRRAGAAPDRLWRQDHDLSPPGGAALDRLAPLLRRGPAWTGIRSLPGGEFPYNGFETLVAATRKSRPFLSEAHARRLVHAYGTRVDELDDRGGNYWLALFRTSGKETEELHRIIGSDHPRKGWAVEDF